MLLLLSLPACLAADASPGYSGAVLPSPPVVVVVRDRDIDGPGGIVSTPETRGARDARRAAAIAEARAAGHTAIAAFLEGEL